MTTGKTAIVFGASGLVGSHLVKELVKNPAYSKIFIVVRKTLAVVSEKVQEIPLDNYEEIDFTKISAFDTHVFCCLGSTIKKAGTKEQFRKVDYELPIDIASWAKTKEINRFVVISSIGANSKSNNFYLQTKGDLEDSLKNLHFPHLIIVRPSLILGTRNEFRLGEEIVKMFSGLLNVMLLGSLKKYRAIKASKVAKAMMILASSNEKYIIYESDSLELFAENKIIPSIPVF